MSEPPSASEKPTSPESTGSPAGQTFVPGVGVVFSADIAVPDHERELRFYPRVLTTGQDPLWREDLMNNLGIPIIGVGARTAETEHLPLQWMPHIQVRDVAESVKRALDRGGSELMHARDNDGNSQWAVLLDPDGAAFGIVPVIPPEAMPPADSAAPPSFGHIAWLDIAVENPAATRDFYRDVIGWATEKVEDSTADSEVRFNLLDEHGRPVAGIRHARGNDSDSPGVWLIHLPVGDLEESLRRVEAEGGRIVGTSPDANGPIRRAVIKDPTGAAFALVTA